jgi:hypothetical protein
VLRESLVHGTAVVHDLCQSAGPLADVAGLDARYERPPRSSYLRGSLANLSCASLPRTDQLAFLSRLESAIAAGRAQPAQRDADGRTAFHILTPLLEDMPAAERREWVLRLFRVGCNPQLTDRGGHSAFAISPTLRAVLAECSTPLMPRSTGATPVVMPVDAGRVCWVGWSAVSKSVAYCLFEDGSFTMIHTDRGSTVPLLAAHSERAPAGSLAAVVTSMRGAKALQELNGRQNAPEQDGRRIEQLTFDLALIPTDIVALSTGFAFAVRDPFGPNEALEVLTQPADSGALKWFVRGPPDPTSSPMPFAPGCGCALDWGETTHTSVTKAVATAVTAVASGRLEVRRLFCPPGIAAVFPRHWASMIAKSIPFVVSVPGLESPDFAPACADGHTISFVPEVGIVVSGGRYGERVVLLDAISFVITRSWDVRKMLPVPWQRPPMFSVPTPDGSTALTPLPTARRPTLVTTNPVHRMLFAAVPEGFCAFRITADLSLELVFDGVSASAQRAPPARFPRAVPVSSTGDVALHCHGGVITQLSLVDGRCGSDLAPVALSSSLATPLDGSENGIPEELLIGLNHDGSGTVFYVPAVATATFSATPPPRVPDAPVAVPTVDRDEHFAWFLRRLGSPALFRGVEDGTTPTQDEITAFEYMLDCFLAAVTARGSVHVAESDNDGNTALHYVACALRWHALTPPLPASPASPLRGRFAKSAAEEVHGGLVAAGFTVAAHRGELLNAMQRLLHLGASMHQCDLRGVTPADLLTSVTSANTEATLREAVADSLELLRTTRTARLSAAIPVSLQPGGEVTTGGGLDEWSTLSFTVHTRTSDGHLAVTLQCRSGDAFDVLTSNGDARVVACAEVAGTVAILCSQGDCGGTLYLWDSRLERVTARIPFAASCSVTDLAADAAHTTFVVVFREEARHRLLVTSTNGGRCLAAGVSVDLPTAMSLTWSRDSDHLASTVQGKAYVSTQTKAQLVESVLNASSEGGRVLTNWF